jgi:prefoldin subunit 5
MQTQYLQHEIDSLRNSVGAMGTVLTQLTKSVDRERAPEAILPAIRTMESDLKSMRDSLDTMEQIIARADD